MVELSVTIGPELYGNQKGFGHVTVFVCCDRPGAVNAATIDTKMMIAKTAL
jgi:hypothetical protein